MVFQTFIYELNKGFDSCKKFKLLEELNVYFDNFIINNTWKGFFARYIKCLEHIYIKNDYSEKNLIRLHLLFTGKHNFTEEFSDVNDMDVKVKIDENYIQIEEQDSKIKMVTVFSYLFMIENHPMQIMYKKYKEYCNQVGYKNIEEKVSHIINFEEDDNEYFVDEFKVDI
jgi:hypothetical protein